MIELVALCLLKEYLKDLDNSEYKQFISKYDIDKLMSRSIELTDDFLKDYVIDKSVTAE